MLWCRTPALILSIFVFCGFGFWSAVTTNAHGRSLDDIRASGELVVGVDIPYGVMEFIGPDGKPAGIDIDIASSISAKLGVTPKFETIPFGELFDALNEGRIDLIVSAVTITPDRQKTMLFSVPYLSANTVLAVSKENSSVTSIDSLKNSKIGVLEGTLGETLANEAETFKDDEVVAYKNNDKRIEDLTAGKIDAAIVHFLIKTDLPVRIIGQPLRQNFYGVVAELKNVDLINEVNGELRAMKRDGRLDAIKDKYVK